MKPDTCAHKRNRFLCFYMGWAFMFAIQAQRTVVTAITHLWKHCAKVLLNDYCVFFVVVFAMAIPLGYECPGVHCKSNEIEVLIVN